VRNFTPKSRCKAVTRLNAAIAKYGFFAAAPVRVHTNRKVQTFHKAMQSINFPRRLLFREENSNLCQSYAINKFSRRLLFRERTNQGGDYKNLFPALPRRLICGM
jgi:hypothetical protein